MTGLEVIGAGFGRTGTQSMQAALVQLGFAPCYHMDELNQRPEHLPTWRAALDRQPVDWANTFLSEYRAAVDWPVCTYWRELLAAFPDAKVILTVRDPYAWYNSVMRTIVPLVEAGLSHAAGNELEQLRFGHELIFERTFDGRIDDRTHAIDVYRRQITNVEATVPESQLLHHEAADGWPPLCAFLGRPIPSTPYPHTNRTDEFTGRIGRS